MSFSITNTQQISIQLLAETDSLVSGIPEWSTDNSDVFTLEPASDGMSCNVKANGPLGSGNVQATAFVNTGIGIQCFIGIVNGSVTGENAIMATLALGIPAEQS